MNALLQLFRTRPHRWDGCHQPTAAERMARYSQRHAVEIQLRENESIAPPRVRLVNGRPVLVALDGKPNSPLAKAGNSSDKKESA